MALAFSYHKPVVPIVLDQEAWDLLTTPDGAARAKSFADSCGQAYTVDTYGTPLVQFEDEEIVPGNPMSLELVRKLFSRLGAINLCPCHDQQIQEKGLDAVLEMCSDYVRQELQYTKQHAELTLLASKRAHISGKDARAWGEWVRDAKANLREPHPTEEQEAYVRRAKVSAGRRRAALGSAVVVAALLIIAGAIASGILAVESKRQAEAAEEAKAEAQKQRDEAVLRSILSEKIANMTVLLAAKGTDVILILPSADLCAATPANSLSPLPRT